MADLCGEGEVAICNSAGIVAGQGQVNLVVANIDVRVVLGRFRSVGHPIDEGHCGAKISELKSAYQFAAFDLGDPADRSVHLVGQALPRPILFFSVVTNQVAGCGISSRHRRLEGVSR